MYPAITAGQPTRLQFGLHLASELDVFPREPHRIMVASNPLGDPDEIEKDLFFLECVRWMRVRFGERVCERSRSQDPRTLDALRLEATYQMAEFYYLLGARDLRSPEQIEVLTNVHNDYIIEVTKDVQKMARLGLSSERLLDAMFTADTLPRLLQNWREKPGAIDQSNLGRFLAPVMSTETCRKIVVACQAAGFFTRERSHYGTVVISSLGVLEDVFGQCLRDARHRLAR
jgi:hypothetical protein